MKRASIFAIVLLSLLFMGRSPVEAQPSSDATTPPQTGPRWEVTLPNELRPLEAAGGAPQTDAFTYQGYLEVGNAPAQGLFDFRFYIYSSKTGGDYIGSAQLWDGQLIEDGIFEFPLDPGVPMHEAFNGEGRWIEVRVRPSGTGAFTTLPRQPITAVPYAWGLRPGAVISGTLNSPILTVSNTYTASTLGGAIFATGASPSAPTITGYHSGDGPGIYGYAAGAYPAVEGVSGGEAPAVGGYGSDSGSGVYGSTSSMTWASTASDAGVKGVSSSYAPGVYGSNTGDTLGGPGIFGTSELGLGGVFHGAYGGLYADCTATDSGYGAGVVNDTDTANTKLEASLWLANKGAGDLIWAEGFADGAPGEVDFRVSAVGNVYADGAYTSPAADFAEMLPAEAGLEPGDVLAIGSNGTLVLATGAYATNVAGVYASEPGFIGGAEASGTAELGDIPLSIVGIVPVKASAEAGAISPGDLLTTADTPGHAMRADAPKIGAIIGKAMEALETGTGTIRMLVTLQ